MTQPKGKAPETNKIPKLNTPTKIASIIVWIVIIYIIFKVFFSPPTNIDEMSKSQLQVKCINTCKENLVTKSPAEELGCRSFCAQMSYYSDEEGYRKFVKDYVAEHE